LRVKVLFDTNALMMPVQFGIDIFRDVEALAGAYDPVTLTDVQEELAGLAHGRGRDAAAAKVGFALSRRCTLESSEHPEIPVDDRIVRYARDNGCIVATNDRGLRKKLLDHQIDVICMREQKRLEILRN